MATAAYFKKHRDSDAPPRPVPLHKRTEPKKPWVKRPSREGRVQLSGWVMPDIREKLKALADPPYVTMDDLVLEAVELLFAKRGVSDV